LTEKGLVVELEGVGEAELDRGQFQ
jgi:hypothetical protein